MSADVASTLDGLAGIDDFDTSFILVEVGPVGGKTRSCSRDRMERTYLAASSNSSKEFGLSRTQGSNSMDLRMVDNSTPASEMTKPRCSPLKSCNRPNTSKKWAYLRLEAEVVCE